MITISRLLKFLFLLCLIVYIVMFSLSNDTEVLINPVVWSEISMPLSLLLLIVFCSGLFVAGLFSSLLLVKGIFHKRQLTQNLKKLSNEIKEIKELG
jgi:uncharacterized membrane protein YciS (DUF1049 family)